MLNAPTWTPGPRRRRLVLLGLAVSLSLGLWASGPSSAPAGTRTNVPLSHTPILRTMIACYDKKLGRWIDKTRPANCDIAGYKDYHGKRFVSAPVEGIKWEEWGEFSSPGELGVNVRTRTPVRVIGYRRMECGDGRIFYSSASVVNLENGSFYWVRLPICDSPAPRKNQQPTT
jgi:hypothetical protein